MAVLALMIVLLPVTSQAGTWKKNSTGWWWQEDNGSWPANQWKYIQGTWYAFDGNGYMRTGWYWDGRSWYYLTGSGAMAEGWASIGGTWYYLQPGNGAMQTGWVKDGDTWYYMNSSGAVSYTHLIYEWGYAESSTAGYDGIVHIAMSTEEGYDSSIEWADGKKMCIRDRRKGFAKSPLTGGMSD